MVIPMSPFRPTRRSLLPPTPSFAMQATSILRRTRASFTFGAKTANLTGRKAHELYATMAEAGVSSQGSPGMMYESLSHFICIIEQHEIAQKGGGIANCTFDPGAVCIGKPNP